MDVYLKFHLSRRVDPDRLRAELFKRDSEIRSYVEDAVDYTVKDGGELVRVGKMSVSYPLEDA